MSSRTRLQAPLPLLGLLLGASFACTAKRGPEPEVAKFVAGGMVERSFSGIGGLVVRAPDNLDAREHIGFVVLDAEGFPTVTIKLELGEFSANGFATQASAEAVTVTYTIPTTVWTCTAEDAGAHEQLVVELCESMRAPINPHVDEMTCKMITGFDAESVARTWQKFGRRLSIASPRSTTYLCHSARRLNGSNTTNRTLTFIRHPSSSMRRLPGVSSVPTPCSAARCSGLTARAPGSGALCVTDATLGFEVSTS